MGKKQVRQTRMEVANNNGDSGQKMESVFTEDDNCLPAPEDLTAYYNIDPKLIPFIMERTRKEQEHRHKVDNIKLEMIANNNRKIGRMNLWGMCFAFLSVVVIAAIAALALYLNHQWIALIFGGSTLISVVAIFAGNGKGSK